MQTLSRAGEATITVLLGEPSPDFPLLQNQDGGLPASGDSTNIKF